MAYAAQHFNTSYGNSMLNCDWKALRLQLMLQWNKLDRASIDDAGPDAPMLANLIQQKYGIASELAENYLRNMARTLPLN